MITTMTLKLVKIIQLLFYFAAVSNSHNYKKKTKLKHNLNSLYFLSGIGFADYY